MTGPGRDLGRRGVLSLGRWERASRRGMPHPHRGARLTTTTVSCPRLHDPRARHGRATMRAPWPWSGAPGVPAERSRGVRGAAPSGRGRVRVTRREEGACRRHVTDEATPPHGRLARKARRWAADRSGKRYLRTPPPRHPIHRTRHRPAPAPQPRARRGSRRHHQSRQSP